MDAVGRRTLNPLHVTGRKAKISCGAMIGSALSVRGKARTTVELAHALSDSSFGEYSLLLLLGKFLTVCDVTW